MKTRKQFFLISLVAIAAFLITFLIVRYGYADKKFAQDELKEIAKELNKTCPIVVDSDTRLDSATTPTLNVFQYNYTLVKIEKASIYIDEIRKYLEPQLVRNTVTNPDFKLFRENKVTLSFNYLDKNGDHVITIDVTPDKYLIK